MDACTIDVAFFNSEGAASEKIYPAEVALPP